MDDLTKKMLVFLLILQSLIVSVILMFLLLYLDKHRKSQIMYIVYNEGKVKKNSAYLPTCTIFLQECKQKHSYLFPWPNTEIP